MNENPADVPSQGQLAAHAFSGGPDPGRTGAPSELTCATGECHGSRRAVDPERFSLSLPAAYVPGQTYTIVVRHHSSDATRLRWGFQITALTATAERAGAWQGQDANTQIVEEPRLLRQYAQHTLAGSFAGQSGGANWTINWTAPASNVGPVTFYAAGNQADNNNGNSGDLILLTQLTIPPGNPTPTLKWGCTCGLAGRQERRLWFGHWCDVWLKYARTACTTSTSSFD